MQPLVSIICLCYNHERFLIEALDSVINQAYPNLEIIVVDDASQDRSAALLRTYQKQHPEIKLVLHKQNNGNCRAFNEALALSTGEYIIDFATDDVLLPHKIQEQVNVFEKLDKSFGIVYTDAELIDEESKHIGFFYKRNKSGQPVLPTPSGYILAQILRSSFLCPPTLMFRREVLVKLGGYDETLAYEDFDIWVRSAKQYQFYFLDDVLIKRRIHRQSLSHKLYAPGDKQLASTVKICREAHALIETQEEIEALIIRVKSEIRQAYFTENFKECRELLNFLGELSSIPILYRLIRILANKRIKLRSIRRVYYHLVYNKSG